MQPCQKLVLAFQKIQKKFCTHFFYKLVLYENDSNLEDGHIRHYDKQCQAAQTLAGTLNTKIKASKFRAFYLIKFYRKQRTFKRKAISQNYSFVQNKTNNSYYAVPERVHNKSFRAGWNFPYTTRNRVISVKNEKEDATQILSQIDYSMSALVKKIKCLNSRIGKDGEQNPQKDSISQKMQKRNIIINKLSELGNDISSLLNQEQITDINLESIKVKTSQGKILGMKSYKTSRQINQTFCSTTHNPY